MTTAADMEQLWRQHHTAITHYVGRRVHADSVEDIVQDTFVRAWTAMLRGVVAQEPRAWLCAIARNLVIDLYRKQERTEALNAVELDGWAYDDESRMSQRSTGEMMVADGLTTHELAEQAITCQRVRGAIGKLPESQGQVMWLKLEGYDYREIATELRSTYGAVKAMGHRAFVALQSELKEAA